MQILKNHSIRIKGRNYYHHPLLHSYRLLLSISISLIYALLKIFIASSQQQIPSWELQSQGVVVIDSSSAQQGFILSPNYPSTAPTNSNAIAILQIVNHTQQQQSQDTIKLSIIDLSLQTANSCTGEAVNIYVSDRNDGVLDPSKMLFAFCGPKQLEPIIVASKRIAIQFISDEFVPETIEGRNRRFKIKFEFLDQKSQLFNGCERPLQFKCRNRKCISKELLCNGYDDCGDASDEDLLTPCQNTSPIPYRIDYNCGLLTQINPTSSKNSHPPAPLAPISWNLLQNRIVSNSRARLFNKVLPQVSIQMVGVEPISHVCGGVLIHPMFVLTSAHCFQDSQSPFNYKLLFGLNDLRAVVNTNRSNSNHYQLRYASYIVIYPNTFYTDSFDLAENNLEKANKLALVELNAPVYLNSHVWPACLPHLGETINSNRECLVAGFGETRGSGEPFGLKQTVQTILTHSKCRSEYSDVFLNDYSMICTKNKPHEGPCNGDSGGPLLCRDNYQNEPIDISDVSANSLELSPSCSTGEPGELIGYLTISDEDEEDLPEKRFKQTRRKNRNQRDRYTVHGITSFTTDGNMGGGFCALDGIPIIYGRVSTRIEWILSVMKTALVRLNKADQSQDINNQTAFFGYLFRTGLSQHRNFTRLLTLD